MGVSTRPHGGPTAPPPITLPSGGGAIRGIGEKFATNPVTGTASVSVPLPASAGRSGFGPRLNLAYDSGTGKSAFGFGWTVALPAISRKTDKGLPTYDDDHESDVFLLAGAEDLVPVLRTDGMPDLRERTIGTDKYEVRRYRPRIEGTFARIERWTHTHSGDTHWRSISRDNVTTLYGCTDESRVFGPADPATGGIKQIFTWLVSESFDDKGNAVVYGYKPEDDANVDLAQAHEGNRPAGARTANRYLKSVRYGNVASRLNAQAFATTKWLFELVLDYGEHHATRPRPGDTGAWLCRRDPFSSYRSGFEVRTYRLCQRILMFHHFPKEPDVGDDCLVRSLDLRYRPPARPNDTRHGDPLASFLASVTLTGYRRKGGGHLARSLPPLEFEYAVPTIDRTLRTVDDVDNLPVGADGREYQLVDLDGEGVAGVLTQQVGAWYYKPGLGDARFGPLRPVAAMPSTAALGRPQLLDLAGDGQLDLVEFAGPTPGFAERTDDGGWASPVPFRSLPNIRWDDGNLRFIDLNGDGHADALLTENEALVWYPSLGEDGFGEARKVPQSHDEDTGPRLVFTDGTQSVYLASMSGDLTDLVRIRNGEVCYWPNLGYGRFGAKVTMDDAPLFDRVDGFDQRRVRLADVDGTGSADLIYLGVDGVRIWFNQSGNRWSAAHPLDQVPAVDNVSTVATADLLGTGTACLVWSSPLPAHARRPLRYIDLMGGTKPHLLVSFTNDLGAETRISYAPSTRFYLADKAAGRPWVTRLPFPVHVVERVVTDDRISRNRFVTRYAYHHGYFDDVEREFRGFGLVEQFDTDEFGAFTADGDLLAASNAEPGSHVPPVLTRTWFHTGAFLPERGISRHYTAEYYREPGRTPAELEALLLDDTVLPDTLLRADGTRVPSVPTPDEQREACRALKGTVLRREVYALDGGERQEQPFTVTESNYIVEVLQAQRGQRHGVFLTHPRESISYRYERTLYPVTGGQPVADPRIGHDLVLDVDPFGTVLKSASIGYGRRRPDTSLAPADRANQSATRVTYTESAVTNPVTEADEVTVGDDYRAPVPCETRMYELTGYPPTGRAGRFRAEDLVRRDGQRLVHVFDGDIPYEQQQPPNGRQRRLIERVRTILRRDDLTALLAAGVLQARAIPGESYQLTFTPGLLASVFQRPRAGQPAEALLPDPGTVLGGQGGDRGGYVDLDGDGHWWIPSGRVFLSANGSDTAAQELGYARDHFFLGLRHRDAFGQTTTVGFDDYDLLVRQSRDPVGNRMTVGQRKANGDIDAARPGYDYRVLQPALVTDANRNRTGFAFDAAGLLVGTAVMGKPEENRGDSLDSFDPDLSAADVLADPRGALARATTRLSYDLLAYELTRQDDHPQPASAHTLAREVHDADPGGAQTPIQQSFSYSDGFGREIQKKIQAEPGPVPRRDAAGAVILGADGEPELTAADVSPRWVASGWTVFNNKGRAVRQYAPFFSDNHGFEFGTRVGVSLVFFYDPLDRPVATLHPDHTYEKVVFDAWRQVDYDRNDTVAARGDETGDPRSDPHIRGSVGGYFAAQPATWQTWWSQRQAAGTDAREQAAARQAAVHAGTPTSTHFDGLGRPFLTQARNRFERDGATVAETYASRVELDIEGNHRAIRDGVVQAGDPLGRIVLRYDYDLLGNRIGQAGMEAGRRWTLSDAAGNAIRSWDSRGHTVRTGYDPLRRPARVFVTGADDQAPTRELLTERLVYGEQHPAGEARNLRGALYLHADQAGVLRNEERDFKGNLLGHSRRLAGEYRSALDWPALDAALPAPDAAGPLDPAAVDAAHAPLVEADTFTSRSTYDALSRAMTLTSPDGSVVRHGYNEASLLERVDANLRGATAGGQPVWTPFVTDIDYNAKGQRTLIRYGNGAATSYCYDRRSLRLVALLTQRPPAAFPNDCPDPAPAGWPGCRVQNLQYTYDPVGNVTHVRDEAQQAVFFRNRRVEPSASYIYDAVYRLIEATGREHLGQAGGAPIPHSAGDGGRVGIAWADNDGDAVGAYTESYVYDAAGNVLELRHRGSDSAQAGWTREFTCGEASLLEAAKTGNRLTSTALAGGNAPTERYWHDEHGNMTRMPHLGGNDPAQNVYWNDRDDVRRVDLGGGGNAYYTYDATGERVRKVWEKAPGLTEERIYLGGFELFRRRNGAGQLTLQRETLHLMDDTRRIALVETRTPGTGANDPAPAQLIRYQLGGHLGSVLLELDDQAQIISYEEYTPYGSTTYQAVRSATETPKRYRYTGKEHDEESGLSYHGARYYAPWLARWTSCDPAAPESGVNAYEYVSDNPMVLFDPDGLAGGGNNPKHVAAFETREAAFEAGKKLGTGEVKATSGGKELPPPKGKVLEKLVGNSKQAKELRLKYSGAQGIEGGKALRRNITERSGAAAKGQEGGHFGEASRKLVPEVGVHKKKVISVDVEPGGQPKGARTADIGIAKEPTSPPEWQKLKGENPANAFEDMLDQKIGEGRVADKTGFRKQSGGVPIEEIRPSSKLGGVAKGLGGKAIGALNSVAPIWDAYKMARDLHIAEQSPGRAGVAGLKDEYGEYTLQIREGLLFNDYQKTYISGEKAGTVQELGFFEWMREIGKRNEKYGYFDWKGDFVPGEVPPIIPRDPYWDNII
ncbi:SpvB/TcaC N-terminal domain-containing protein [Actinoplanes sp. NPDC051475]|uniref:SpvB/TcaC N-terminal domain-containing protein n=1 Tax=Actinoplanes sp. NPDC051475 TaxID=3157225 RepID=UPI00344FDBFF